MALLTVQSLEGNLGVLKISMNAFESLTAFAFLIVYVAIFVLFRRVSILRKLNDNRYEDYKIIQGRLDVLSKELSMESQLNDLKTEKKEG